MIRRTSFLPFKLASMTFLEANELGHGEVDSQRDRVGAGQVISRLDVRPSFRLKPGARVIFRVRGVWLKINLGSEA